MSFDPPLTPSEVERAFQGRFAGLEPIYVGGQGAVFKATPMRGTSSVENSLIALKVYFPEQLTERTEREVAALRHLQAPSIVSLIDSGRVAIREVDCVYVATEFIEGEVLSEVIRRGILAIDSVIKIGIDIASAIDIIWSRRIVHRDIKPPNIMIKGLTNAVLIDLGVARHLSLHTITQAGMTWGTVGYMAPEHAQARRQLSCKADVFSLGIVLQEALIGRHPTNGRQDLLMAGGLPTNSLRSGLGQGLCELIDSMVHRDAVRRPLPEEVVQKFGRMRDSGD